MGVRVSTNIAPEGFTLTREDGWFDLLVNGGGAVTLQFGRSPFKAQTQIVNVPWNEVMFIKFEYRVRDNRSNFLILCIGRLSLSRQ